MTKSVTKKTEIIHIQIAFILSFSFYSKNYGDCQKKGLNFDFISDFPILFPKSRCSLKKKSLHLESIFLFPNFRPNFSRFRAIIEVKTFFLVNTLILGEKTERLDQNSFFF